MWSCMLLHSSRIAQNFTSRNIGTFPHWARQWPLLQCGFQSLQLSPTSVLDLHMRNRAVLSWIMQIAISALSQNGYVCYTNFTWNLLHGTFGLHTSCASEAALWTTVEALKSLATSTIFCWTLFMLHYSFLVYDTHQVPCSRRWRCVPRGCTYLQCYWSCWCDCTSKNCLRSQVLALHLPRRYKFGEQRVAAKLVTCLMRGAQKITSSFSPLWSVRCQLVLVYNLAQCHPEEKTRMLGTNRFQ